MFLTGYEDEDEFDHFVQGFDLRALIGDLKSPFLIVAGEDDHLSPIEHTYDLYGRAKAPTTLVVYEGADHGVGNAGSVLAGPNWMVMIADWLNDRIAGREHETGRFIIESNGRRRDLDAGGAKAGK